MDKETAEEKPVLRERSENMRPGQWAWSVIPCAVVVGTRPFCEEEKQMEGDGRSMEVQGGGRRD